MPRPKYSYQTRLTVARANCSSCSSTIQSARASRRVLPGRISATGAVEELRRHGLLGGRVLELAAPLVVPDAAVLPVAVLDLGARQEGGHAEEVVLGEVFERMVVTLGALDAFAQEEPRHGRRRLVDLELLEHEVDGGMPEVAGRAHGRVADGGEHFANGFVVRRVALDQIMQPALVGAVGAALRVVLRVAEPVLELDLPVAGVVVAGEQVVDEAAAFIGARIVNERDDLFGRRQHADQVEEDAAHKDVVGGQRARTDVDAAEFREDALIDEVGGGSRGIVAAGDLLDHDELGRGGLAHRARHGRGAAAALGADGGVFDGGNDGFIVDLEAHAVGHVPGRAVGEASDDDEGLARAFADQDALLRVDFETLERRA